MVLSQQREAARAEQARKELAEAEVAVQRQRMQRWPSRSMEPRSLNGEAPTKRLRSKLSMELNRDRDELETDGDMFKATFEGEGATVPMEVDGKEDESKPQ
eukprot:2561244-Pyramimonas_sp.AAC.1